MKARMKKKALMVGFLVISLFIIAGCGGQGINDQGPEETIFRTGTQGLDPRFPPNVPAKLFEGDNDIDFVIELRNRGAFPQTDLDEEVAFFQGRLFLGGFDKEIIDFRSVDDPGDPDTDGMPFNGNDLELEGKSPFNNEGGFKAFSLRIDVEDFPEGFAFYNPKVKAAVNYRYQTVASPTICVDPEPLSTTIKDKPCDFTDSVGTSSQGAPVAITQIEQDATRSDMLYKIHVENVGTGRVLDIKDNGADISNNPFTVGFKFQDLDKVTIGDVRLGNLQMTSCRPKIGSTVRLIENKGIIFCQVNKNQKGINAAFQTPIVVRLKYGYQDTTETTIEISEAIEFT